MQEVKHLIKVKIACFTEATMVRDEAQAVLDNGRPSSFGEPQQSIYAVGRTTEENMRIRMCWNKVMCGETQIPKGYQNIAVLIVKWNDELDQLESNVEGS